MSIKNLNYYIYNFSIWFVVMGYVLKSMMKYLPLEIRQWLVEIPYPFILIWLICFTLVFLNGGIHLMLSFRENEISKRFWSVLSSIAGLFLVIGTLTFMVNDTLQVFKKANQLPFFKFHAPEFKSIEEVLTRDDLTLKNKADIHQYYAQYVYTHEGKIVDVYNELGEKSKFKPSKEDIEDWNQTKGLLEQGETLFNTLINRIIYAFIAFIFGLLIGLIVTRQSKTVRA